MNGLLDSDFPQQPVLVASVSYLIPLLFLNFIHINFVPYIFLVLIFLLSLCIYLKNSTFIISLMFLCASSIVFFINFNKKDIYFNSMKNKDMCIICHLVDYPFYDESHFKYVVEVDKELNNKVPKFKMNLYSKVDLGVDPFKKFKINVHTYEENNIKQFLYLKSQGIYLSGNVTSYYDIEYLDEVRSIRKYLFDLRDKIINYSTQFLNLRCENFIKAILFGDKNHLNQETKTLFYKSGVAHLLAISGFHFSLLTKIFYNFLKLFNIRKRYIKILCMFFIVFLTLIIGFHPSSIRAGIMLFIHFLSKTLFLKDDSLNSLGLALIIILLFNPNSCADIGLFMSFLSSASIILFSSKAFNYFSKSKKNKSKILKYIVSNTLDSIIVSACTLPITCLYFKYLNSLFILSNLIIPPYFYILVIFSLFSIFSNQLFKVNILNNFLNSIVNSIISILEKISTAPQINLDYSFVNLCVSSILIIISFSIIFSDPKKDILKILEMSLIFFSLGIISYQYKTKDSVNLKVIGSKDILISNGKDNVLIFKSENFNKIFHHLNSNSYKINIGESKIESNTKIKSNNLYNFYMWGNKVKILMFTINNNLWIQIKIFDEIILISPNGADVRYLPENLRKCNIFIAFKLPNKFDMIKCNKMIYTDNFIRNDLYNKLPDECLITRGENFHINFNNDKYVIKRNF